MLTLRSMSALLLGTGILLMGNGYYHASVGLGATLAGFSSSAIGLLMAGYFLGFIIGTFWVPTIMARVGHIRTFAALAAIAAATAVAHYLVIDPWFWGFLRLVSGVCVLGIYMVIESWLNQQSSAISRGRIFGIYMTVVALALAVGQLYLAVDATGSALAFGIVAILFCIGLVPIALTRLAQPGAAPTVQLKLRWLFRQSPVGTLGALIAGLVLGAFWSLGAVFAHQVGLEGAAIGGFVMATLMGGIVLQYPLGHLSDRHDRRTVLAGVALAGAVASAAAVPTLHLSPTVLMIAAFLFGGFSYPLYALSVAHTNDHLSTEEILPATRGILLVYGIGATLGPVAAGSAMDWLGPGGLFAYFALFLALLGVFGWYRRRTVLPVPVAEQSPFVAMNRTSQAGVELYRKATPEE